MRISARRFAVLLSAGLSWLAVSASADTLQMKDGRVIQGTFFGGTQATVQFETRGKIELYSVDDIISVTFTTPSPNSPAPCPTSRQVKPGHS